MKLMILDGNSVINRAYYGVHPLTTRDGMYTNAIFGFLNILERVRREERPEALCVAFDLHGPTFRHLKYEAYKANRHGMPEELAAQMPVMKDVLRAMNIPIYECQGWEADDVIGTVSRLCADADWDCVILTGDRDSLQLVNDRVTVKLVRTQGGQTRSVNYDPATFEAEYGLEPIRLIDLKALMGDSSDNIPGVAGVGPKTATELLHRFGTLDGVYENLTPQNMKGKLYEKLVNGREMAYLSYELATIRCDAPLCFEFSPEKNLVREPKRRELYDLFTRLEFQKLIDQYGLRSAAFETPETDAAEPPEAKCDVVTAETADEALALLDGTPVAVAASPELDTVAVCRDAAVTLLKRERLGLDHAYVLERLFDRAVPKTAHDVKPLMRRLLAAGIDADGFVFDTALAAYLLDATRGKYELPQLAQDYLHTPPAQEDDPDAQLAAQAVCVQRLQRVLSEKLEAEGMTALLRELELPLCRVLAHMEHDGVPVDRAALEAFSAMLSERIAACERLIYGYSGEPFNIQSPRQLGVVLFEKLGLPPVKKTKSGYSTNAEVLEKLRDRHPIIQAVMDYRMLTKLQSTYAEGLQKEIAPDGRIHTTFQNTVTATGRLSSTEPNLQNIPVRTELGSEIRKMFVPRPGWVLVDADYSQIELRVLAHIADDRAMQEAFRSGEDFHRLTASRVFHVPPEDVTPLMRRQAKAVNFGIVYGISEFSLAQDIGVSRREAKEYIERYLTQYPGVRDYMKKIVETARTQGYVSTLFGRRRMIPEIRSTNFNIRSGAERIALNTPVQGTAADIMKLAMVRVFRALETNGLRARLLLQVHDELIVECPPEEAGRVRAIVADEMEHAATLAVPLVAEAKSGESWYDAK
ncbi:MAG: DNA polymerase I [Candidatus Faecousia sp.]|uniref:DNA polymerase I n=1 Tax=Faecousia sp. TaxID=2952921 RepID=UPI002A883B7E|nr:DNA polymerase I [Candidatus Faecousia sp.]